MYNNNETQNLNHIKIFVAKDGKKFLHKQLYKKYESNLFYKENIKFLKNPDNENERDLQYLYIKDKEMWNEFIQYLSFAYPEENTIHIINVVLNAIQEVETEMSNYANALKTIEMGQQVVEQGNKTLELSIDLYKRGLGTFTNVLDAQRTVLSDQNYLVSAWNSALLALVRLYTALGGSW